MLPFANVLQECFVCKNEHNNAYNLPDAVMDAKPEEWREHPSYLKWLHHFALWHCGSELSGHVPECFDRPTVVLPHYSAATLLDAGTRETSELIR